MTLETVFLYSAIAGGVVLLSQLAMMFFGFGEDFGDEAADVGGFEEAADGFDGEDSGGSSGFWFFEMLSIRTLAAAATFFGLVGGMAESAGLSPGVSVTLGGVAGYGAMYAVYWTFRQLFKLETSGNENIKNAVGLAAEVYVPIDGAGAQAGKVHVVLQGRTAEFQAWTDNLETLPTGSKVIVTEVIASDAVKVAPLDHST